MENKDLEIQVYIINHKTKRKIGKELGGDYNQDLKIDNVRVTIKSLISTTEEGSKAVNKEWTNNFMEESYTKHIAQ